MGTSHSVELVHDADSPTEPGKKSVVSGSLDDLDPSVTGEQFLHELLEFIKFPIDPMTEAILKSCTVTENKGPDDFTVKVVVDGKKLDSYGYGRGDGMDRVRSWKRVAVDRQAMRLLIEDFVPEHELGKWADEASDKEPCGATHVQFLKDPTRVEFWYVSVDGVRRFGEPFANALYAYTDRVISELHSVAKAKVKAAPGKAIKNEGEESVISGSLEDHVDYASFFDKMVTVVREKLEKIPEAEVEVSEGQIVARAKVEKDGQTTVQTHTIQHSEESGEMSITHRDQEGKLINSSLRVVHRSPFVVEAWNISVTGERTAGIAFAKLVQKEVNEVIDRANSWFG